MIKPISYPIRLSKNPKQGPKYAAPVKLKGQTQKAADPRATRALIALMDMQAQIGGAASHFGGPSAFAEMMSALHAIIFTRAEESDQQWYELFNFVNDAGHCENGIYALKAMYGFADLNFDSLKGFRSVHSPLTGHGEAALFPEGVWISNGPLGSGLPQAQGLALADALAGNSRVTVTAISDGGCMEGEAREALAAIPGLAHKGKLAPFVLLISDNNTKLSGRIDEEAFSMKPTFSSLEALGWKVVRVADGHDLQGCADEIDAAIDTAITDPSKPVALWVQTVKGYGSQKAVASSSGGHGFPLKKAEELPAFLKEIYNNEPYPEEFDGWIDELKKFEAEKKAQASDSNLFGDVKSQKVQVGVAAALSACRASGLPVISVSSDLPGSTGVAGFQKDYPEATQDVGVAEANMISTAIGLSKAGFIPVVDTFSQFGVTKGALPFIMASLSEGPLIAIFSHAGFQDAADGASHQALSYFAMTCSLPHTKVFALTSSDEAQALVTAAIQKFADIRRQGKTPDTYIFFLGRENFPSSYLPKDYKYNLGDAQVVFDTVKKHKKSVTIVAEGPMLHQAILAAYKMEKAGLGAYVVNPSIINLPDMGTLRTCLRNTGGKLITVEDHQKVGGMGAILTHALALSGIPFEIRSLGVEGVFGQSAYMADELYAKHGLDSAAILKAAKEMLA